MSSNSLKIPPSNSSQVTDPFSKRVLSVASPACLAMTASQGAWRPAKHLLAIDRVITRFIHQNQTGTAKSRILILDSPPRHGKSEYISKHLTAWFKATYPEQNVFLTSYESAFAADWGTKARAVLSRPLGLRPDDPSVISLFGLQLDPQRARANDWGLLGYDGTMRTAGAGGAITGKGAHLMVIDDPIKNAEEANSPVIRQKLRDWLESTVLSRLEPNGCLVLMATRWHRDDPSGYLLQRAQSGDGEAVWHVHLPALAGHNDWLGRREGEALWPDRWPAKRLHTIRRTISTYWWQALYQGIPTASTSVEWPDSYFGPHIWVDDAHWPDRSEFDLVVLTVDPSRGKTDRPGDYTAIVLLGIKRNLLYVDCSIERRPMSDIVSHTVRWADTHRPHHVGIESNTFQELLAVHFEEQTARTFGLRYPVWRIENKVNKVLRIRRLDPYLKNHEIRFRHSSPGCHRMVEQLRDFPLGEYDDGPDALEMAVRLVLDTALLSNP